MAIECIKEELSTPVRFSCDVLVAGGGTAGTIAAIAAARNGANVILVERGSYLGGTLLDGAGVLAGCDVKSDRGFRRDYYAVAVAPQEVSVVLEIFRIDPA